MAKKVDAKVKNLFKFFIPRLIGLVVLVYGSVVYVERDPVRLFGIVTLVIIVWLEDFLASIV